ncbi:hypothetical protein [Altererythrobacter aquiaggeris]|uniref:hypothetical protein n=1 Tax=Aestuarierythrobacter aquiaggeris TaxID=1898396 RepID=UPI0030160CD5
MTACSGDQSRYPSLAIRDVERVGGAFGPASGPTDITPAEQPGAETLDRLEGLRESAIAIHREFVAARPVTARTVTSARSADVASDRWASAQVALSDLESIRSRAAVALADIDLLYVDATTDGRQLDRISQARADVLALIDDEDAALGVLRAQMAR